MIRCANMLLNTLTRAASLRQQNYLIFSHQTVWHIPTPNGGVECRGYEKIAIFNYAVVQKNAPTLADYKYDPVQSILIIFSKLFVNDHKSCLVVNFPPHRTYVATIPCETQCSILH